MGGLVVKKVRIYRLLGLIENRLLLMLTMINVISEFSRISNLLFSLGRLIVVLISRVY